MLETWIRDIHRNTEKYKSGYWRFQISGNRVELSVTKPLTGQSTTYRCSIITIGQVLVELSRKIEEAGLHFHIQTFPNLESPEVIAVISMEQQKQSSFPVKAAGAETTGLHQMLHSASASCKLELTDVTGNPPAGLSDIEPDDNRKRFLVSSRIDNPFTWLNLGYFKETILQYCNTAHDRSSCTFLDFCDANTSKLPRKKIANQAIPQAIVLC